MAGRGLLLCLLLALLSGCSAQPDAQAYAWQVAAVQSMAANGEIIACRPGLPGAPDSAAALTMTCRIADGTITLTDVSTGQSHTGTWERRTSADGAAVYRIVLNGEEGIAGLSMTTQPGQPAVPTLLVRIGDYTLTLYPE